MLKIVHLLTGVAALLLSFIPSLQEGSPPYLEQHDALYLALFGLLNLTLAPVIPYWNKGTRHQLQNLVSALLVLTVVVQTLTLLAPMPEVGGHPAILLSLESPFAALGGWLLLGELLSGRALIGCGLMLAGMLLSQLWPALTRTRTATAPSP